MSSSIDPTGRVGDVMGRINAAWSGGRPEEMASLLHEDMVMVFPGFAGRVQGADAALAGFEDFCRTCRLHAFREHDRQIDVIGAAAVVSFAYEMTYERGGASYQATGRDLWIFAEEEGRWRAVWRTMLDVDEAPVPAAEDP